MDFIKPEWMTDEEYKNYVEEKEKERRMREMLNKTEKILKNGLSIALVASSIGLATAVVNQKDLNQIHQVYEGRA